MAAATATATVGSWDEKAYDEAPDTAITKRAEIAFSYDGDIQGDGKAVLLLAYTGQEAEYVGLERLTATIGGRSGTFVVSQVGAFRGGTARSTWNVVPGSGTGELAGLSGTGTAEAGQGNTSTITFDYELGAG